MKKSEIRDTLALLLLSRVNLIGEHTDYNLGLVFPMALPLVTVVVGAPAQGEGNLCQVVSGAAAGEKMKAKFSLDKTDPGEPAWANYVKARR